MIPASVKWICPLLDVTRRCGRWCFGEDLVMDQNGPLKNGCSSSRNIVYVEPDGDAVHGSCEASLDWPTATVPEWSIASTARRSASPTGLRRGSSQGGPVVFRICIFFYGQEGVPPNGWVISWKIPI